MRTEKEIEGMINLIGAFSNGARQLNFQCEGNALEIMLKTLRWVLESEVNNESR
jgi:hypothetical protein